MISAVGLDMAGEFCLSFGSIILIPIALTGGMLHTGETWQLWLICGIAWKAICSFVVYQNTFAISLLLELVL